MTLGYSPNFDFWLPFACRRWFQLIATPILPNFLSYPRKRNTAPVAAIVSNCWAQKRLDLLKSIMKRIRVDSYGTCEQNMDFGSFENASDLETHLRDKRLDSTRFYKRKIELIRDKGYPFVLAAENSEYDGYITEKASHAFMSGAVPVYWGAPDAFAHFGPIPILDVRKLMHNELSYDEKCVKNQTWKSEELSDSDLKADLIVREIEKILNDPSGMHRSWRRSFGRGHKNGYSQFSPMINRCIELRDEYNVFAAALVGENDLSESMRRVRNTMDHSDMFSLDELVCASCKAALKASE